MKRAFPGERRVWLIGGGVLSAFLVAALVACLVPREHYTGTNSVGVRSVVAEVKPGQRLCVPQLDVPDGTGRVRIVAFWSGPERPAVDGELRAGGDRWVGTAKSVAASPSGPIDIPVREVQLRSDSEPGSLCVSPRAPVNLGGMADVQADQRSPTIDGNDVGSRVSVSFLPPEGDKSSGLAMAGDVIQRAALFRPGYIGSWTYVVLLLLWPLLGYAALWLLATRAQRRGGARSCVAIAALAFATAASWSLITPPFDAPDEPDHVSYAQTLAETGKAPEKSPGGKLVAYSTQMTQGLDAVRVYSHVELPDARTPWLEVDQQRYQRATAKNSAPSDNGGGYLPSTSTHGPVYYGLTSPAYALAADDPFSQLTLMRLFSALLSVVAAACAFLTVRELVPRMPVLAAVAGLVVVFQPMFSFISGSVNNDTGVNAAAALLIYLLVRGLRRGLTLPLGVAIAAVLVVVPLMKGTGYGLYPAALVGIAGMLWRRHSLRDLPPYSVLGVAFVGLTALWTSVSDTFGRTAFTTPGGTSPTASNGIVGTVLNDPGLYLSYVWQVFLPRLPFMNDLFLQRWPAYDIYVERGWAAFGWYAIKFPMWVYVTIALAIIAGLLLCAVAVFRERAAAWARGWELAVLLAALFAVVGGVEAAYVTAGPRVVVAEQGRYVFTAMVPLAAIAAGACLAFGRARAVLVGAVLVSAMVGLAFLSQLLALRGFYT